jgi:hypothetical protein
MMSLSFMINELVPFAYTTTMFGGRRQWFMCLKCGRRCRRIFGGRYFRCRQCYGLVYASTREPPHQRAIDRADRLRNAWVVVGVPSMAKTSHRNRRVGEPIGGSNNNMRSCWAGGQWVSWRERRNYSNAYDEDVS